MVTDTLTDNMDYTPTLSVKKIKGVAHKNDDVDGTCKRSLTIQS